jgi:hypothetical protein
MAEYELYFLCKVNDMDIVMFINNGIAFDMKWVDNVKHPDINYDEWSECCIILNSETNFQAYKFTHEYSALRLIASCPFQVYFTGNHYYYDPNMLTDISYSTSLSNSLEQTINSIVSDIYYWGKNFPSISNTIIDLDEDQHDDSFKTTVTHTINQPAHTIVDINQTDDNTQLSSSDSDRPNIQTGNDDNEEIIDSLNIDDEDNRLLVVTGDKIRTVDNVDDTTL